MSSRRFCSSCGKKGVVLHDNFCEECFWKDNNIIDFKQRKLEIAYCLTCYGPKLPTGWSKGIEQQEIPDVVGYAYMRNIIASPDVDIQVGEYSKINWLNPNPEFMITYIGISDNIDGFAPHREEIEVEIKLLGGICKACVRKKTGSHDVTVQLRAKDRSLTEKEIDIATKTVFSVANELFQESTDAYVSDIIENHGGVDIYLGSNSLADDFISHLKKIWIAHHEKNYKLVTEEKDNKRVYRITHLFRLPGVKGGEIVLYKKELYRVDRITSQSVRLIKYKDHTGIHIRDWENLTIPNPGPSSISKLVVSEDNQTSSYLLMDLANYDTEEVNKDQFPRILDIGEEVQLIIWENKYFLPI